MQQVHTFIFQGSIAEMDKFTLQWKTKLKELFANTKAMEAPIVILEE